MILVFGKTGQVASALAPRDGVLCLDRSDADLAQPGACAAAIHRSAPRAVINAAAYTGVDAAENEEDMAKRVNGDAPREMAQACATLGIPIVHISTDYVFDGSGRTPWKPQDPTEPTGAYGRSKLAGEVAIRSIGARHVILRTSWVFSDVGSNFLKTMLRFGRERESLNVVDDQIGGPTPAAAIAGACLTIATRLVDDKDAKGGTYHFSGRDDASWADFAQAIFQEARLPCTVNAIPSSEYPTTAVRPLNSRLDCTSLKADFGIDRPPWRSSMETMIAKLTA